jgi:hypothetical protein
MEVIYKANDGKVFETEEECLKYESQLDEIMSNLSHIHMYDEYGNEITLDKNVEDWEYSLQDVAFIEFDTQKAIDCFASYAISQFGLLDIEHDIRRDVEPGERYFYDWDQDAWRCLEDRYKKLNKIAQIFRTELCK